MMMLEQCTMLVEFDYHNIVDIDRNDIDRQNFTSEGLAKALTSAANRAPGQRQLRALSLDYSPIMKHPIQKKKKKLPEV